MIKIHRKMVEEKEIIGDDSEGSTTPTIFEYFS